MNHLDLAPSARVAYCKCGSAIDVRSHHWVVDKAIELFWQVHTGEQHGPCSLWVAAKARATWGEGKLRDE